MLEIKDLLVQSADKVILDRVSLSLAEGVPFDCGREWQWQVHPAQDAAGSPSQGADSGRRQYGL